MKHHETSACFQGTKHIQNCDMISLCRLPTGSLSLACEQRIRMDLQCDFQETGLMLKYVEVSSPMWSDIPTSIPLKIIARCCTFIRNGVAPWHHKRQGTGSIEDSSWQKEKCNGVCSSCYTKFTQWLGETMIWGLQWAWNRYPFCKDSYHGSSTPPTPMLTLAYTAKLTNGFAEGPVLLYWGWIHSFWHKTTVWQSACVFGGLGVDGPFVQVPFQRGMRIHWSCFKVTTCSMGRATNPTLWSKQQ